MSGSIEVSRRIGRYALHGVLATGGMATVHVGRLAGDVGFSRTVAIKRLHPQYASDPDFVSMFTDEARLAGRLRHPNIVPVTDVITAEGEVLIVMDYVQGETLSRLVRAATAAGERVPPAVAAAILCDVLEGLHAAHESRDERGQPLGIVHRDISPQNIIVGVDGIARVLDFGIAKARGRSQVTRDGQLKGKLSYMAPEQLFGEEVTAATDVFASAIVLWETLTGGRLFAGSNEGDTVMRIVKGDLHPPSSVAGVPPTYDAVVMKGLERELESRYRSAREMAAALASVGRRAEPHEVATWVERVAMETLTARRDLISGMESVRLRSERPTRADLTTDVAPTPRSRTVALMMVGVGVLVATGMAVAIAHWARSSPAASTAEPSPLPTASAALDPTADPDLGARVPTVTDVGAAASAAAAAPIVASSSSNAHHTAAPIEPTATATVTAPPPTATTARPTASAPRIPDLL